jgi:murein L,D-transpeptidase YcbB/YkuD
MRRTWIPLLALVGFATAPHVRPSAATLRIDINIPAFRLDAFVGDSLVRTMPIAVGMPSYKSPRGDFTITSIEWNPWWNPPASPWAAKEKRTPPGPGNPMGRVKLNFRDLYFLHGTPLDASIGSAASHGCIRLHNADAIALARLVHQYGTPSLSREAIDALAADTATKRVELEIPVPISLRYDRVEIHDDSLFVYRDVYGLTTRAVTAEIMERLASYGIDTSAVDTTRLRQLARNIPRRGNVAAVSDLGVRDPHPSPR